MSSREHEGRSALASGLSSAARSEAFAMVSCAVAMAMVIVRGRLEEGLSRMGLLGAAVMRAGLS